MSDHPKIPSILPRREFLKLSAAGIIGTQFLGLVMQQRAQAGPLPSQKNIILIITDQERPALWWPSGWADANLPNTKRLQDHGLTFTHAFTAAAMCTVARNTMFTGLFPAQHHSKDTLTEDFQQSTTEHQLDHTLPNLATCLKEAGYDVIYKGKWHMSSPVQAADGSKIWDDISRYGFDSWDAPDAGGDTAVGNFGGADAANTVKNDQRFVDDAVAFLTERISHPTSRRYCLIVSLVNPHDVLSYPGSYGPTTQGSYYQAGDPWIAATTPPIATPPSLSDDLSKKPSAQLAILASMGVGLGPLVTTERQLNYLNFYGRLMMAVDAQIGQVLTVLDPAGDGTGTALNAALIIRTSDHGEMALAHHGLRQKAFVAYEEVLRVPLIWSNPGMFPAAKTTDAMVSHVDLLPTLCELTGVPNWQGKGFKGIDYSEVLLQPDANTSPTAVQPYVLFTFDDIFAGQDEANTGSTGVVNPPNRIQAVRTADFKLARYWDGNDTPPNPDQGEFYDLRSNGGDYYANGGAGGTVVYNAAGPLEMINLSNVGFTPPPLTSDQQAAYAELQSILQQETGSGGRLAATPLDAAAAPQNLKIQMVPFTAQGQPTAVAVQITFISAENTNYQIQKSPNLSDWAAVGGVIAGNNGPCLFNDTMTDPKAFYRIQWSAAS